MKLAAVAFVAAALVLGGCASTATPEPAARAVVTDRLEMEVRSWGRLVSRWSVEKDGKAVQTGPEPNVFNARELVTRRFDIGAQGFSELQSMLGDARKRAGQTLACEERLTDLPYGKVRWAQGSAATAELAFDSGCRDAPTRTVVSALQAADTRVAEWAKAATIIERGPVPRE